MNPPVDLMKAIRSGELSQVVYALDSGAEVELDDGHGNPGLPLAIACFMGHAEIVRELALRGAKVNFADNSDPSSPLAMAVRARRTEVVKVLIEVGAEVPANMHTGLSEQELTVARWKAYHFGALRAEDSQSGEPIIEEIQVLGCYGTDTNVLNAEMGRLIDAKIGKK